jgi:hypothetical protein
VHSLNIYSHANLTIQRDPGNPLSLYTFGMKGDAEHETFSTTPLGPQGNETSLTSNFAIWATAGLTPMKDGKTVVGVFPALNVGNDTTQELYSTMFQMEVVDPTTVAAGALPPFERLGTGRLFYPNEVGYGELAILATDDYLYLLGADVTGVKLARTPNTADTLADRNHYQYWNSLGQTWQSVPLDKGNVIGNIITWSSKDLGGNKIGPANGDLWYDEYHKTYVMVWGDSGIDGTFWYSAANDPTNLAGGWSDPVAIYTPPQLSECADTSSSWNYCGHSHPGWDTTGKTLLLSYSSCASYISSRS